MARKKSYITVTDQFCGAGGSSIGASDAGAEIKLAMNHWKLAIETHNTNFPNVEHDCADISAVDPRRYSSTDILITSPECTNHTLAKGKPRRFYNQDLFGNVLIDPAEERSRATMWDVPRFAEYHDYNIIVVENVVDAARWRMWDAWLHAMCLLGYEHETVYFNSMFAWPTPQSRDRLYVVFWKSGNKKPDLEFRPLAHCPKCTRDIESIQTWKKRAHWGRYKRQYFYRCPACHSEVTPYYYAAFNAIDFNIPTVRIGDRQEKDRLVPKTIERIRYGLEAYGRDPLIVTGRYTSGVECRVKNALGDPIPTQPGDSSHAVVLPWIIDTAHSSGNGKYSYSSKDPIPTQTTRQTLGVVSVFLTKNYGGAANPKFMNVAMHHPTGTITTSDHHALIEAKTFVSYYYKTNQASGLAEPLNTMTAMQKASLVQFLESLKVEDLYYRMLQPSEIGKAMSFRRGYVVLGNNRQQVKQYGNAVTPPVMEMLIKRCVATFQ
jgi:DNA (cytosine-5)-methyltransferase 1